MAQISLTPQLENRSSSLLKDAKMVNCYVEPVGKDRVLAVTRPGFDAGVLYEAGDVQGVVTYLGVARMVVNNKFYYSTTASWPVTDAAGEHVDFI